MGSAEESWSWSGAPLVAPPRRRTLPTWLPDVGAPLLAVGGPTVWSWPMEGAHPWLIVLLGVAASSLNRRLGEERRVVRAATAVLAGLAVMPTEGQFVGLWLAAGIALADWAVRRWAPLPGLPHPSRDAPVAAAIVVTVGSWPQDLPLSMIRPAAGLFAAAALTLLGSFVGNRLREATEWFGRCVGRLTSAVGFGAVALGVLVVPWMAQRLVAVDLLATPGTRTSQWVGRGRSDPLPLRPWNVDRLDRRLPRWYRVRRAMAVPVAGAVIAAAVAGAISIGRTSTDDESVPAAYAGDDWYPTYVADMNWALGFDGAWKPLHGIRVADMASRYVNVADGRRATWTPPACSCRRLSVWIYGGSTTFGVGQRDDHTIASELAKIAAEDGLTLDVWNRGQPGQSHWSEAQRLAWDLTTDPEPDLVVFYDGVNEVQSAQTISDLRLGDPDRPIDSTLEDTWRVWDPTPSLLGRLFGPGTPEDASLSGEPVAPPMTDEDIGELGVARYERSRKMSEDLSVANDLPIEWFWQPSAYSRPLAPGEDDAPGKAQARAKFRAAETRIPAGVHDLTHVFDDVPGPLFSDDVHHNEPGARIVAAAMYTDLRGRLTDLAGAPGG